MTRNLLDQETSPYLLQHRDNPVHWRPWGPEALLAARNEDKPILLSVGYAACHWCHVMAHESFEDAETAAQINADFIPIKVDREERPDVDMLYQSALSLLGQRGGWPLTMFLTPEGAPFWGGTYFPVKSRYGLPSFRDVLSRIVDTYHRHPDKVATNAQLLRDGLIAQTNPDNGEPPDLERTRRLREALLRMVDTVDGGMMGAPKFPNVPVFLALWQEALLSASEADNPARTAVLTTLDHMCQGGIYDHLGGGFARYSTDEFWLVPHFEKMLYDNAALIELLTLAWQETREPLYAQRVEETVAWLEREMLTEDGAFAATLDADSDGEEGKFYVWSAAEIDYLLTPAAAQHFREVYDATNRGNWEGSNVLHRNHALGGYDPTTEAGLRAARHLLWTARADRVAPARDDKILSDWNGMMVAALTQAAFAFGRPDWRFLAERAFRAVQSNLGLPGDKLFHSRRLGRNGADGLLDDYAQMARAALLLYETGGTPDDLLAAIRWVDIADQHFSDAVDGGYYLAADDADDLVVRTKGYYDQATPSGNGVMIEVLARLFYLTGDLRYADQAERTLTAFAGRLQTAYASMTSLLNGWSFLQAATQIVIVGDDNPARLAMLQTVAGVSVPLRILSVLAPGQILATDHPARDKITTTSAGVPTAFICRGPVCSAPITELEVLRRELKQG